ncbi:hypothetical protein Tco_0024437 [Tanacetum coccineum]
MVLSNLRRRLLFQVLMVVQMRNENKHWQIFLLKKRYVTPMTSRILTSFSSGYQLTYTVLSTTFKLQKKYRIRMSMKNIQVNTKFVNHLQPEWIRFVMAAKQARDQHKVNFDQLYAFLKHNENDAKEVREMKQRHPYQLALLANNYNPPPSYSSSKSQYNPPVDYHPYQPYQIVPSYQPINSPPPQHSYAPFVGYGVNIGKSQAIGLRSANTVSDVNAHQSRVTRCYNCKGEGYIAKQCTAKKRVKDSEWFKEKMLLVKAHESRVVLHEDQQDFLANRLEEMDSDYDDLQLHITSNFKADHADAYDSDCDDEATACAIFMVSLSPAGSINRDTAGPSYDSELISEVPNYDTYHEDDILNDTIQEMKYNEHFVSNDNSCDELTSNSNVISYADYMVTIENNVAQYVPPPEQDKNAMILSVIKHMKGQLEQCNMVNQKAKCVNESLSSKLERYKEKVKVLEEKQTSKEFLTQREAHLDS